MLKAEPEAERSVVPSGYEVLFRQHGEPLIVHDRNYRYVDVNDAYADAVGLRRDQIVGRSVFEVLGHERARARALPLLDACYAGRSVSESRWLYAVNRGVRFFTVDMHPLFDARRAVVGAVTIFRDLTPTVRCEADAEGWSHLGRGQVVVDLEAGQTVDVDPPLREWLGPPAADGSSELARRLVAEREEAGERRWPVPGRPELTLSVVYRTFSHGGRRLRYAAVDVLRRVPVSGGAPCDDPQALARLMAAGTGVVGLWSWAPASGDLRWHAGMQALHALPPAWAPTTLGAWRDLVAMADRPAFDRLFRPQPVVDAAPVRQASIAVSTPAGEVRRLRLSLDGSATRPQGRAVGFAVDITELLAAQRALRREIDWLTMILDQSASAIIVTNAQGRCIFANDAARGLFGAPEVGAGELALDDPRWAFRTADGRVLAADEQPFRLLTRRGDLRDHRCTFEPVGGDRRALSVNAGAITEQDGSFGGAVFVLTDRTREDELQQALATKNRWLEQIVDCQRQLLAGAAPAAVLEWLLRRAIEQLGAEQAVVARTDEGGTAAVGALDRVDVLAAGAERWPEQIVADLLAQSLDRSNAITASRGSEPGARSIALPCLAPEGRLGVLGLYGIRTSRSVADLATELQPLVACVSALLHWQRMRRRERQADNDRRDAEALSRAIIDLMPTSLLTLSEEGHVLGANEAAARVFAYGADELRRMPVQLLLPACDPGVFRTGRPDVGSQRHEWIGRRADGSEFPVRITIFPLPASHLVRGAWGLIVEDRSSRFAEKAAQREALRMQGIAVVAGGMAHDFNNLLCVIIGELRHALTDCRDESAAGAMERALDAAGRSAALCRRLLDYSRRGPEDRKAEVPLRLGERVRLLAPLLKSTVGRAVELELDFPEPDWIVLADGEQFDDAVMNLVVNARDSMARGGRLSLAIRHRPGEPGAGTRLRRSPHLVLTCRDSGEGIDPAVLPRVFDPFFSTKRAGHGSGLGLSVTKAFVEGAGGEISIESKPGAGTTVTVRLPATPGGAAARHPPAQADGERRAEPARRAGCEGGEA